MIAIIVAVPRPARRARQARHGDGENNDKDVSFTKVTRLLDVICFHNWNRIGQE
jgi:hypothetical protein